MSQIIRGTTPTFKYTFNEIDPNNFEECFFTIKQYGKSLISKSISDGTIEDNSIHYLLSQEETLSLTANAIATAYLDWKLNNGIRGAGNPVVFSVYSSAKEQVI